EQSGPVAVRDAYFSINLMVWSAPSDSYVTRFTSLLPFLERLCKESGKLFGCVDCLSDLETRRSLGLGGIELNRLMAQFSRLNQDFTTPVEGRVEQYRELKTKFEQMGYETGVLYTECELARLVHLQGDPKQQGMLLQSALERARRDENSGMTCELLGEIG